MTGIIMGIDCGTRLGWAVGRAGDTPRCGSQLLRGKGASDGSLLAAMADWLAEEIAVHKPDLVAYEAPLPGSGQFSTAAAKIALRLSGLVELICWRRSIRVTECHVLTIRKALTGSGRCGKPGALAWVKEMGWEVPIRQEAPDEDAIDALAVWGFVSGIRSKTSC